MKTDKVLEEFLATKLDEELNSKTRGTLITELPSGEDLPNSEDLEYFNSKLVRAKRTLDDIKISDQLNPLLVDAKLREGNVIEPDKEIEWKDVKEKG
ncbi:hypothetical protein D3C87_622030 [compost metagenome]